MRDDGSIGGIGGHNRDLQREDAVVDEGRDVEQKRQKVLGVERYGIGGGYGRGYRGVGGYSGDPRDQSTHM